MQRAEGLLAFDVVPRFLGDSPELGGFVQGGARRSRGDDSVCVEEGDAIGVHTILR